MRNAVQWAIIITLLISNGGIAIAAAKQRSSSSTAADCVIKGNISKPKREKIYHLPTCSSYKQTIIDAADGERWFCSEKDAVKAGWRKALNCKK